MNEAPDVGAVKYYTGGLEGLVRARRQAAYDEMAGACAGGRYRIVAEETGTDVMGIYAIPEPFVLIRFACVDGAAR